MTNPDTSSSSALSYDLSSIVDGYAQGYFLMAESDGSHLSWYSSRDRTLIPLDDRFRYPKSLRRFLNQKRFQVHIDRAFRDVVEGCADRESTWISNDLKRIYWDLHQVGLAHSFETWRGDELAGGILGITLGGAFIGESMFYRRSEGSKVAMVKLVEHLRQRQFLLFDAQMMNPLLARFGAFTITDEDYRPLLKTALQRECSLL